VVEDKSSAAITQDRLVQPRLECGKSAARRALKVAPLIDRHRVDLASNHDRGISLAVSHDRFRFRLTCCSWHEDGDPFASGSVRVHRYPVTLGEAPEVSKCPCVRRSARLDDYD
jgi:hypothetical protein